MNDKEELEKIKTELMYLKEEWMAQYLFLTNPHDDPIDQAVGRTYKECADILENRFGI